MTTRYCCLANYFFIYNLRANYSHNVWGFVPFCVCPGVIKYAFNFEQYILLKSIDIYTVTRTACEVDGHHTCHRLTQH